MSSIKLVGKPNAGKSSLFNLLTGLNQKIANYSGATVEKKKGQIGDIEIVDLPGLNSLHSGSIDQEISKKEILKTAKSNGSIVFVANGIQLEDNLLLFSEIADLQSPMIMVINFIDDLQNNKIEISATKLSDLLGCPVFFMNSRTGEGLDALKVALAENKFTVPNAICRSKYDFFNKGQLENNYLQKLENSKVNTSEDDIDFFERQRVIAGIVQKAAPALQNRNSFLSRSRKWDKFALHPLLGLLLFVLVLWFIFQSVFFLAGFPMDWIDASFASMSEWASTNIPNEFLSKIISEGILPGLGGVLIFIPQIAILFFLLGVLEHSGYLARISFISNRFLSRFGLSGQSVIPLMSSWACAIPAIMSARIINDPKERMAVIMASPLMTCSARLPVYTILIAIMFPSPESGFFNAQGLTLLALYLLGVFATLLVALLVSKKSKVKSEGYWSLELPVYRVPNWRNVLYNMYHKTKAFVVDAGKIIFMVAIVLWFLASYSPRSEEFIQQKYEEASMAIDNPDLSKESFDLEYSYAGYLGKIIEPAIRPLGYDWKIGIALISSFAAREVFVGSLSTIYSVGSEEESLIKERMQNEINPFTGEKRFNVATCISLLLFYVFALQCMSTMAIVKKEVGNWKYPIMQFVFMLILAYVAAFIGYRLF